MASEYSDLFKSIANAKPMNTTPRLPDGTHSVIVQSVRIEVSVTAGPIIIASLEVADPDPVTYEWPWFVGNSGWAGKYAVDRCAKFMQLACDVLGIEFDTNVMPDLTGAPLVATVTSKPHPTEGRMPIREVEWSLPSGVSARVPAAVLERVAIAAERRALAFADVNPELADAWMQVFKNTVSRI